MKPHLIHIICLLVFCLCLGLGCSHSGSSADVDLTKVEDAKYKHVQVWLKGVGAVPNVVSPNSEFGFYATYIIADNTTLDVTIPIELGFAIMEGGKTLYSDSTRLEVPKDKVYITEKNGLRAGRVPGKYSLQVWIKYKDKVRRLATKLEVR